MDSLILCFSLCVFSLGTYLIWWDRKNVFNHFAIGFVIIGYIIPSFVFDFELFADRPTIKLYLAINVIGAFIFIIGLLIGNKWKKIIMVDSVLKFSIFEYAQQEDFFQRTILLISKKIFLLSIIIMPICFIIMGYVPMFANDPFLAKQFKGPYQPSYQRVAFFYRTAKQFIEFLLPLIFIEFYCKKKISSLLYVIVGLGLILVTLNRSSTVTGLIFVFSIIISLKSNKISFFFYLSILIIFFSLGSAAWAILSYFLPGSPLDNVKVGDNIAQSIAFGSPDIPDQLKLLEAFIRTKTDFTYGLTFFGGLIPFNFPWNPQVWTLAVLNDTNDISEIGSGGLRVPVSLWGYFCFGWIGTIILPFLSGFFTGYITKKIKYIISKLKPCFNDYITFYFIVFLYLNIAFVFTDFYRLTIYSLPAFIFYALLIYLIKKKCYSLKNT
jgi:hypothetical protein